MVLVRWLVLLLYVDTAAGRAVRAPIEYARYHEQGFLDPDECDQILQLAIDRLDFQPAKLVNGKAEAGVRRASCASATAQDPDLAGLYNVAWELVNDANEQLWRFPISARAMEPFIICIYDGNEQGAYTWHEDVSVHDSAKKRVLSATVQLSESSEYSGGDLVLFADGREIAVTREKGSIIMFPSTVPHQVKPVTRGKRKSLVLWFDKDLEAEPDQKPKYSRAQMRASRPKSDDQQGSDAL